MEKVSVNPATGCWEWLKGLDKDGYAKSTTVAERAVSRMAHRYTYTVLVGEIPAEMQMDHRCRVRKCVNPSHLETVTLRVNVDRSENYIAENRAKTHCPHGHPYEGENLIVKTRRGSETRVCRTCRNEQAPAAFYANVWSPDGRGGSRPEDPLPPRSSL